VNVIQIYTRRVKKRTGASNFILISKLANVQMPGGITQFGRSFIIHPFAHLHIC
jgi:hypothetical protein